MAFSRKSFVLLYSIFEFRKNRDFSLKTSKWVINPFSPASSSNLSLIEEEELIDIRNDRNLKDLFERYTIENFWIKVAKDYPSVARKAFIILLQFSTSYLCELGFSVLTNIKCKKRERLLSVEAELRVALCDFPLNIQNYVENIRRKRHNSFIMINWLLTMYTFRFFFMLSISFRRPKDFSFFLNAHVSFESPKD